MQMICSRHHKRGERVLEFNINPFFMNQVTKNIYRYREYDIFIVSEGWQKVDGYYYKEIHTSEGICYIPDLIYKLHGSSI